MPLTDTAPRGRPLAARSFLPRHPQRLLGTAALLAVLPILAPRAQAPGSPRLSVQQVGPGLLRLAWPGSSPGTWQLEESATLGPAAAWRSVPAPPTLSGNELQLTLAHQDQARFFRLRAQNPDLARVESSSPAHGETGVSVTRETILRLSSPLAANTIVGNDQFHAESTGRRLLTRLAIGNDRRSLTLFPLEPQPAGARVRVSLVGDRLKDESGLALDADGDGLPGGTRVLEFDTMNATPVAGTAVRGRVFASELVAGPDTGANAVNRPLPGVIITVDGREETLRATTDAQGSFVLTNCPAGRFFVHVDGHLAEGSQWPRGAYYPVVGKAWEAVAGRGDNLAGGTGEIFLPLIRAGTLQPVSSTQDTAITFPPEVLQANPALDGVSIVVPANALVGDDGVRGGRVGIAPVPPNRLPEPLPPGLELPLVITVQTDGPLNFDRPAPACFPNLPDPVTKQAAAPGSQQWLYSFNHDKGAWEGVGAMTVTSDGRLACTDPGVGIRQPGWHGVGPRPVEPPTFPTSCPAGTGAIINTNRPSGYECLPIANATVDCAEQYRACRDDLTESGMRCLIPQTASALGCFTVIIATANPTLGLLCLPGGAGIGYCLEGIRLGIAACDRQREACESAPRAGALHQTAPLPSLGNPIAELVLDRAVRLDGLLRPHFASGQPLPEAIRTQARALLDEANAAAGGDAAAFLRGLELARERARTEEPLGNAPPYPVLYAAEIQRPGGTLHLRGLTAAYAQYQVFVPRDGTLTAIRFYDPRARTFGVVFPYQRPEAPYRVPRASLFPLPANAPDSDHDALPDEVELVFGTSPSDPDSDDDGSTDGAEVLAGANPLDGRPSTTGIVASAATPGTAFDITTSGDLAVLALRAAGLGVVDLANPLAPVLLTVVDTPGNASAVALDGRWAAVADAEAGLTLVDLANLAAPPPPRTIPVGNAFAVAAAHGIAYVGAVSGGQRRLVPVHMQSGTVLDPIPNLAVHDVAVTGDTLWCLLATELRAYRIEGRQLVHLGTSPALTYRPEGITDRKRLFVGGGQAYAAGFPGADFLDVRNPAAMTVTARPVDRGVANSFKHLVTDGGGLGVAAVGVNPRGDGTHDVYLYDVANPAVATNLLTVLPTPGLTYAVALHRGYALAADGTNGLQVLNYLPPDLGSTPPTASLAASFPLAPATAEESRPAWIAAIVADDVAVRSVEFLFDGVRVAEDHAFPFEHRFVMPPIAPGRTNLTIQIRATDTGGNARATAPVVVALRPDRTPPTRIGTSPSQGAVQTDIVAQVTASFDEALATTPAPDALRIVASGPDDALDTADDVLVTGTVRLGAANELVLDLSARPLSDGLYRAVARTTLRDRAGNPLAAESTWTFTVRDQTQPALLATKPWPGESDIPSGLDRLSVSLNEPARAATVGVASLELRGAGPDHVLGTFDDPLIAATRVGGDAPGRTWEFAFAGPLPPDLYRATLSSNVADLAGNRLAGTRSWTFDIPLRTTLRVRALMPDRQPAPGVALREHDRATPLGRTDAQGSLVIADVPFRPYATPDFDLHLVAGNRAFLGRALRVRPVPGGITDLGAITLAELCDPRLESHASADGEFLEQVTAFATFDDGSGPALFALGQPRRLVLNGAASGLFRHDGRGWRRVPATFGGLFIPQLRALAVHDDGRGPALYVGGSFESVAGLPATNVARWNGRAWQAVGDGLGTLNGQPHGIHALLVHDDGTGPALYAGGRFDVSGSIPIPNLARWNGNTWTAVGGGILGRGITDAEADRATVEALARFDDGSGPMLVASGTFQFPLPGATADVATNIVRWQRGTWTRFGSGLSYEDGTGSVSSLAIFDEGQGPRLFAAGQFDRSGPTPLDSLARWNGTEWTAVGTARFPSGIDALGVLADTHGPALIVSGPQQPDPEAPGTAFNLSRWDGRAWTRLGGATDASTDGAFAALAELPPTGSRVWMLGGAHQGFVDADGELRPRGSVRWNGHRWEPAEDSFDGEIFAVRAWDDGTGAALYLGGTFTAGGGQRVVGLARWDGSRLQPVGAGLRDMGDAGRSLRVVALVAHDDGSGPALHVAGTFATADSPSVTNLARWNGRAWSTVGGLVHDRLAPIEVRTMAVYNHGTGAALYIGGAFDRIRDATGTRNGRYLARWDGHAWQVFSQIGNGQGTGLTGIGALLPVESGPTPGLYVGGIASFVDASRRTFQGLARWDGTAFQAPGDFATAFPPPSSFVPALAGGAEALAAIDSANGPEVFLAATFYTPVTFLPEPGVARLRDGRWERLPPPPGNVRFVENGGQFDPAFGALSAFDDGFGPRLFVAARIESPVSAPPVQRHVWARWNGVQWDLLDPQGEPPITSNLLPFDVDRWPALLRAGSASGASGPGLVRWTRPTSPCR